MLLQVFQNHLREWVNIRPAEFGRTLRLRRRSATDGVVVVAIAAEAALGCTTRASSISISISSGSGVCAGGDSDTVAAAAVVAAEIDIAIAIEWYCCYCCCGGGERTARFRLLSCDVLLHSSAGRSANDALHHRHRHYVSYRIVSYRSFSLRDELELELELEFERAAGMNRSIL